MTEPRTTPGIAFVVATSALTALAAVAFQCEAARRCVQQGGAECRRGVASSSGSGAAYSLGSDQCSFTRFPLSLGSARVCVPGEHFVPSFARCMPMRSYPDALERSIMRSPSVVSDGTAYHQRACGAWIDAGQRPSPGTSDVMWAFYDAGARSDGVRASINERHVVHGLSSSSIGKFHQHCTATTTPIATQVRAMKADLLQPTTVATGQSSLRGMVLRVLGRLLRSGCVVPVRAGLLYGVPVLVNGSADAGLLVQMAREALQRLDTPWDEQSAFDRAATRWQLGGGGGHAVAASNDDARRLLGVDFAVLLGDHAQLDALLLLAEQDGNEDVPKGAANAFLHGLAATCAVTAAANLDASLRLASARPLVASLRPASAFGRLKPAVGDEHMRVMDNATLVEGASVTFLQQPLRSSVGNRSVDCAALATFLFPDELDRLAFHDVVSPRLYARLEPLVERLRSAVATEILDPNGPASRALPDATRVAHGVRRAGLRVAGAPAGTWAAGKQRSPVADLSTANTPLVNAARQARALFDSQLTHSVYDDLCNSAPLFDSLSANAYIMVGGGTPPSSCIFVMLGMLRRPFADETYTNTSMHTRIGYVVAHELAHVTLASPQWNETLLDEVLIGYRRSTRKEALADIVAVRALVHAGMADPTDACMHISQLWCARTAATSSASASTPTHPPSNHRGDMICRQCAMM